MPEPRDRTATTADDAPSTPDVRRPAPYLFRVLHCEDLSAPPGRYRLDGLDGVSIGRGAMGSARRAEDGPRMLALTVPDSRVSARHARLRRLLGRWVVEDGDSRNGTLVNGAKVRSAVLADGDQIECGRTFFLFRSALATAVDAPDDREGAFSLSGAAETATLSPALERELTAFAQVVRAPLPVLIRGETGTGKEVLARALHVLSGRPGPLIAVNCGALPGSLVESELFGYRRGAFSDAKEDRPGLVRSAEGGTLFLDEIGDLPAAAQAALLRVLQEREVLPLGATRPLPVDFRLCSASHRDLPELARRGAFRSDLLARVSGFDVRLPPLRERREDMGLLLAALARRLAASPDHVHLRPEAARALLSHDWPLNIRELETALGVALTRAQGSPVALSHLPESVRAPVAAAADSPGGGETEAPTDDPRREELRRLLAETGGNLSAIARAMGKDRVQIRRWLRRYRLDPRRFAR
jgi:sigma-54 dependent transcriptional regulator, acetoin dehydrogenase operon transcriptional activator AcoR